MSLRSLKSDLDALSQLLLEKILVAVEQHGLDPDAEEVHDVIANVFGETVRYDFADWVVP